MKNQNISHSNNRSDSTSFPSKSSLGREVEVWLCRVWRALGLGELVAIATLLLLLGLGPTHAAPSTVIPYPDYGSNTIGYATNPNLTTQSRVKFGNGFQYSTEFKVTVNDTAINVYNAFTPSCYSQNQFTDHFNAGTFRICTFAFTGTVTVKVQLTAKDSKNNLIPITSFEISPQSNLIQATATLDKATNTIVFSMPSLPNDVSQKLEIRINGKSWMSSNARYFLYILADAPESYPHLPTPPSHPPSAAAHPIYYPDLIYFPPGIYTPPMTADPSDPLWAQTITIDKTVKQSALYLAPGAILNANILIHGCQHSFHIYGHGFLQNPYNTTQKKDAKAHPPILDVHPASNSALEIMDTPPPPSQFVVEDINLINSVIYNLVLKKTGYCVLRNLKCLHSTVNSDGIVLYTSSHNQVLDCLIANNDNQIVIGADGMDGGTDYNLISGCVFISTNHLGRWLYVQGDLQELNTNTI